ncbi:MAG TPA: GatB/YqeY domain-containing protein [Candidatus Marinimicrobia bacterium]|nr:GatB/YqeY domain-containing protein [Candidatus Neomarinimicrobiota bacterium]HIO75535.1 GatB/YqeY domain-containing protein [Candidatus Neomarinimicrobiota bacterium]HIO89034.1 GatB/YqeY domain-containing protein [Candidatus Neomarinimicrobiota bacterium]
MTLVNDLQSSMQAAMKSGDSDRVRTLRTLMAKLKERSIEKRGDLDDGEIIKVLQTAAKQRKESAEMYEKGDRNELAETELNELAIIEEYLPVQMSKEALAEIVDSIISETGAESMQDMGKVMPKVMKRVGGQADGKTVQELVKKRLSS